MARAHHLVSQVLLCLLVSAAASLDEEGCASQAAGGVAECRAAEDESSAMLQVTSANAAKATWTKLPDYNCYPGFGASSSEGPTQVQGGLAECQARYSGWDGIVMDKMQITCWGIRGVDQPSCKDSSDYDTWIKSGSSQGYCGRPCTFSTESTDCGGDCGLCDGQMCTMSIPVPTPVPSQGYCGRACTFSTELTSCGGECGLCDGQMCTMGTPPSPPTPHPTPPAEWTLYGGHNCYDGGHGAAVSEGPVAVTGFPDCWAKFSGYDGVVLTKSQLQCWGISGITLSQCVTGDPDYDTYLA